MRRYTFPVLVVLLCSLPLSAAVQLQSGRVDGVRTAIMPADINGDGLDDIVSYRSIQLNLGGRFGPMLDIAGIDPADYEVGIAGTGNFNNDAYADLIVRRGPASRVFLGNGSGGFTTRELTELDGWVNDVFDFTGDGIGDLIVGKPDRIALYKGAANATFSFLQTIPFIESYYQPGVPPTADFNEDGRLDFVLRSETSFHFLIAKADGTFEAQERFARFGPGFMGAGDLNGDGHADVAFLSRSYGQAGIGVLYGDGTGRFPGFARLIVKDEGWYRSPDIRSLAVGDFVEGGAQEIVFGLHEGDIMVLSGMDNQVRQIAAGKLEANGIDVYPMRFKSAVRELIATGYVRYNTNMVAFVVNANGSFETPQAITRERTAERLNVQASGGMYSVELDSNCPIMLTEMSFEREGLFLHFEKTDEIESARAVYLPEEIYVEIKVKDGSTVRELIGSLTPTITGVLHGKLMEVKPTPCGRLWALHKLVAIPMR